MLHLNRTLDINLMKTTKILFVLLSAFILTACFDDPGTEIVWGKDAYLELDRAGQPNPTINQVVTRVNDGEGVAFNVQVNIMGRPQKEDVTVDFTVTGTAIDGVHYDRITTANSITIPAGSNTANIEFEILDDNLDPTDPVSTIIVTITGGDLPLSNYLAATFRLVVACPSDLGGTYSYSLTNVTRAGVAYPTCNGITGNGTLTEQTTNGVYAISDGSFGQFACAYPPDTNTGGTLRLNDLCENLFWTGTDKYGDSYSIDIVSVTATVLTFDWVNTYGDGGRVALTRTDAKTWPLGLNTD